MVNANERSGLLSEIEAVMSEHEADVLTDSKLPSIPDLAFTRVREFLLILPKEISDPDPVIDPDDGAISLEWYAGYRNLISVSFSNTYRLPYATLDGEKVSSGVCEFSQDSIPPILLEVLLKFTS